MRFRPEDGYCKPAVARETKVTNLVLRVKRRKKRPAGREPGEKDGVEEVSRSPVVEQQDGGRGFPPAGQLGDGLMEQDDGGGRGSGMLVAGGEGEMEEKGEEEEGKSDGGYEYSAEVLGLVDTSFEFPGTCILYIVCGPVGVYRFISS